MWNQNEGVQLNNKGMSTNRYGTVAPEEGRRGHPQSVREFTCCVLCSMISRKDSNVKRVRSRMSFMFPWLITYTDLIYLVELELARTERDGLRIFFLPFPFLLLPSIFLVKFSFLFYLNRDREIHRQRSKTSNWWCLPRYKFEFDEFLDQVSYKKKQLIFYFLNCLYRTTLHSDFIFFFWDLLLNKWELNIIWSLS